MIERGHEPLTFGSDEGDAHVAVPARGGNLVIVGDETYTDDPFGFAQIIDTSDSTRVGAFAADDTLEGSADDGLYLAHNVVARGNRAYFSWYDDGVRVVDFSKPSQPREIAAFSPGGGSSFWSSYVHENLVLGSDFAGGGLYILQVK